jgi:prolyl oligopeptidase
MKSSEEGDRYISLEDTSSKQTTSWALKEDRFFRRRLKPRLPKFGREIARYYKARNILQVKVTKGGTYYLERQDNSYRIRKDQKTVIDSAALGRDYIIFRFYTDDAGERMAYFASKGEDSGTLHVIDAKTGREMDRLEGDIGEVAFSDDGFYHVKNFRDERSPDGVNPPTSRVMKGNKLVFGKGIETNKFLSLLDSNGKALVTVLQWSKTDVYAGDLEDPGSWKRQFGGNYLSFPVKYVKNVGLLILAYDGRGNGRILLNGKTLVKEGRDVLLEAAVVGEDVICNYLQNCASSVKVYDFRGSVKRSFAPAFKSSIDLISSNEKKAVLVASSFAIPYAIFEYSSGKFRELEKLEMVKMKSYDGYATSRDGTRIHYFQLGKRTGKTLVWGYGGFSIPRTPIYDPMYCALVGRGVTCVLTNLRGGDEYGERWHRLGKREKKQNVFDDYAAVLGKFKNSGSKVVAFGRSNGGLLVGATITQHPELVDGALIGYPVLDMLRFHKMLVGSLWTDEYGNPDNPRDRKFLIKYSPYHNVKQMHYPPTMIYTSLHDDRVHPGHAFKFAARLAETGSEVWLRVQSKGGHGGANTKTKIDELADMAGFVAYALNRK